MASLEDKMDKLVDVVTKLQVDTGQLVSVVGQHISAQNGTNKHLVDKLDRHDSRLGTLESNYAVILERLPAKLVDAREFVNLQDEIRNAKSVSPTEFHDLKREVHELKLDVAGIKTTLSKYAGAIAVIMIVLQVALHFIGH
jgi:hypothetical protein